MGSISADMTIALLATLIISIAIHTIWMAGVTVMQVSKGYYILDNDAPQGLRLRKWFLIILAPTITIRAIAMATEILLRNFLHYDDLLLMTWAIRTLPSVLFLLAVSFLGDYLWQIVEMLTQSNTSLLIARYSFLSMMIFLFAYEIFNWTKAVFYQGEDCWQQAQRCCAILSIGGLCITFSLLYGIISVAQSLQKSHVANASKILARFLLLYGCLMMISIVIGCFRGHEAIMSSDEFRGREDSPIEDLLSIMVTESIGSWLLICTLTNRAVFIEDWLKKTLLKSRRVNFVNTSFSNHIAGITSLPVYSHIQQQEMIDISSINYSYVDSLVSLGKPTTRIPDLSEQHVDIPTYHSYGAIS